MTTSVSKPNRKKKKLVRMRMYVVHKCESISKIAKQKIYLKIVKNSECY